MKFRRRGQPRSRCSRWPTTAFVKGFTTNPTLMRQSGVKDYAAFSREVLQGHPGQADLLRGARRHARRDSPPGPDIAGWGDNVYVKVPITNSEGVAADRR